jgi:hypothetical protein
MPLNVLVMPGLVPGIHVLAATKEGRGWPGDRRAEATPSFGRLCPAMTERGSHLRRDQVLGTDAVAIFDDLRNPLPVTTFVVALVTEDADGAGFLHQR